jgi:hypothetical protein
MSLHIGLIKPNKKFVIFLKKKSKVFTKNENKYPEKILDRFFNRSTNKKILTIKISMLKFIKLFGIMTNMTSFISRLSLESE